MAANKETIINLETQAETCTVCHLQILGKTLGND